MAMKQTSVHLKPCNTAASEIHNRREKDLDYIRKDLSHLNESFSYIPHTLSAELANIKKDVKAKTGRKLQKNAIPIKEGVVVIDEDATLADLKNFCEECRLQFSIRPLQIHIHRDEGHPNSKTWKPNLHAHIVWCMYDDKGRNVRLSPQNCRDMQTLAAKCLRMERGKQSDKKHLDAIRFKTEQEEKRLEWSQKQLADTNTMLAEKSAQVTEKTKELRDIDKATHRAKKAAEGAFEGAKNMFTGKSRHRAETAEKSAAAAIERAERAERQLADKDKQINDIYKDKNNDLKRERTYRGEYSTALLNLRYIIECLAKLGLPCNYAQTLEREGVVDNINIPSLDSTISLSFKRSREKDKEGDFKRGQLSVKDNGIWQRFEEWFDSLCERVKGTFIDVILGNTQGLKR